MSRKKKDTSTFEGRIAKQGYHKVGLHSAAKPCKWSKDSILKNAWCYKNKFYGIKSHQCLQCSPVLQFCNLSCKFCWRLMPEINKTSQKSNCDSCESCGEIQLDSSGWVPLPKNFEWDSPQLIADGLIHEQKRIMSGFLGNKKADKKLAQEAMHPKHVALSLIGEPTLYPKLSELINIFHKKKMTTFLVTNGTYPDALEKLDPLPTQLYVSLVAPDVQTYQMVTQQTPALTKKFWSNYLRSLDFLKKIKGKTRTTLRTTLAHNLNYHDLEKYADLIKRSQADYVEIKSMVFVGGARNASRKLKLSDMIKMDEVDKIANKLCELTGYLYTDSHAPSRVVLLCRDKEAQDKRYLRDIDNDGK